MEPHEWVLVLSQAGGSGRRPLVTSRGAWAIATHASQSSVNDDPRRQRRRAKPLGGAAPAGGLQGRRRFLEVSGMRIPCVDKPPLPSRAPPPPPSGSLAPVCEFAGPDALDRNTLLSQRWGRRAF